MIAVVAMLALAQLPPGFESRQNGRRLSSIQQGTIDCRPPLLCTVRDTTLSIYQGAASDLSCVGCVSDGEIVGVSGSKVTGAVPSATALATNPTDCSTGQYAKSIDAQGNLTCEAPAGGSTPNVTCAADEALTWTGAAWGCVSKVRAAFMADAGVTAQTATALAANPTDCGAGAYATAIDSSGNLTCSTPAGGAPVDGGFVTFSGGTTGSTNERALTAGTNIAISTAVAGQVSIGVTGTVASATSCVNATSAGSADTAGSATTAGTASALAADPADCSAGKYANAINASGTLTCGQVAYSEVGGTPTLYNQTVQDEGSGLTQRATLNFTGTGVTCADDTTKTTCTINSGSGISFAEAAAANLSGAF